MVQDLTRFAADEDLFHQSFDGAGLSTHAETRKYDYVAALSREPGNVFIEEYRSDKVPQAGSPNGLASAGFAILALVFHPDMQGDFDFDCEGQGEWRGQPSWLVHFRQRPDRPNQMHGYSLGDKFYRIDLKGRSWISVDTFQILRMEADMVNPMREIQLLAIGSSFSVKEKDSACIQTDWNHRCRWRTFRHSVGTMLAEMGEHQLTIRDYLRHSNLHVTNKYLQATSKTKRLAQDKLVDAILPTGILPKTNLIQ